MRHVVDESREYVFRQPMCIHRSKLTRSKCSTEYPACSECRNRGTRCAYAEPVSQRATVQPQPDINAPRRPKPAHVLFDEHVRRDPALSNTPPTDVRTAIEKRWKGLPQEERMKRWEAPVAQRNKDYADAIERYENTENFQKYQAYLDISMYVDLG